MTNRARILRAAGTGRACTLRELAGAAALDLPSARNTVRELRRDHALRIVGTRRDPHSNRPVALYMPAPEPARADIFARLWAAWGLSRATA